jgi:quercetin dioxygenase-like cupin family protein
MTYRGDLAAAALAAALSAPSSAQTPTTPPAPAAQSTMAGTLRSTPLEPFVYQPAAEVAAMTHFPDKKTHSKVISDHEYYWVEYVTRGDSGNNAEAHGHWYDYIHVLDGEGTITVGGTQDGARDAGNQEMRGGTLNGAKTITLKPGDRLVIPPGLPHLFTATKGNTFTYLIFKQRA